MKKIDIVHVNRLKEKTDCSEVADKAFIKMQHFFSMKILLQT